MGMHSASTVLDDIIDELRLRYDSSVGLLDGDAVREIPNLNTLQNLGKLLTKLSASLTSSEEKDQKLLLAVDAQLDEVRAKALQPKTHANELEDSVEPDASAELETTALVKRERSDDEEADDLELVPLAKRLRSMEEKAENDAEAAGSEENEATDTETDAKESDHGQPAADEPQTTAGDEAGIHHEHKAESIAEKTAEETTETGDEKHDDSERPNSVENSMPPVQTGSYTQENDTRLKNPKSEFVSAQTLSESAIMELGLFSEEHNGLETQGKAYLKKKYGVALYPENDLTRMLPGEIPDVDFSKTKAPSNQVQFSTYQSYIESFFRPFVSEDITFVKEKYVVPPGFEKNYDPVVSPYLIPKLGDFYTEAWAEEDAALGSKLSLPTFQRPPLEAYKPKGDTEDLVDEKLLTEDVSCGPLSSRLLLAILSVHEVKNPEDENDDGDFMSDVKSETSFLGEDMFGGDSASQLNMAVAAEDTDFLSMEERLKRELKYIGIFSNTTHGDGKTKKGSIVDSDDWIIHREDDEICAEIRLLQSELKGAVVRNRKRKKALLPVLEEHLAYQEFSTILEDLDKQVDQAYIKRLKAKNKRKKLAQENTSVAQQQTANSGLKTLLEKRTRWISNIGKLFAPPEVMKRIPENSVFEDAVQSDDDEVDAEVDVAEEGEEGA